MIARQIRVRILAGIVILAALLGLAEAATRAITWGLGKRGLHRFPAIAERHEAAASAPVWDVDLLFVPAPERPAPIFSAGSSGAPAWTTWSDYPASAFPKAPSSGHPAPGTVRIACIGDSTTFSGYPDALERLFDQRFGPGRVQVLNLGASSADLPAVTFLVERFLPDWHADLAVAYLGRNDILFDLARARVERARETGLRATPELAFRTRPPSAGLPELLGLGVPPPLSSDADQADIDRRVDARIRADLDALVAAIRAAGARPWLSTLAAPGGAIDPASREFYELEIRYLWPTLGSFAEYRDRVDAFNRAVRDAGRDLGAPIIDVAPGLTGSRDIFTDICHLDGNGVQRHAEIAAQALAPSVEALLRSRAGLNGGPPDAVDTPPPK